MFSVPTTADGIVECYIVSYSYLYIFFKNNADLYAVYKLCILLLVINNDQIQYVSSVAKAQQTKGLGGCKTQPKAIWNQ